MKRIFYLLSFLILLGTSSLAQDDGGAKIRERMQEYLQKRLHLSKSEAERFGPVFLNYFNDLRKITQEFKSDRLLLQQKIVDLRLHYREEFKPIMGEKRSNDVFQYEREFIQEVKELRDQRLQNQRGKGVPNNLPDHLPGLFP
ncbi:MAG: hypothetical protein ICV66_00805 [Chitinophagaceae bacterium]|nr:hypothetical protein [Chitinophagaceae bacterium]